MQVAQGLEHGLPGASSIVDRTIPTFSRGELPHFAGINTFMKVHIRSKGDPIISFANISQSTIDQSINPPEASPAAAKLLQHTALAVL